MPVPVFVSCLSAFLVVALILAIRTCTKYGLNSLADLSLGALIGMLSLVLFLLAWAARTGNLPSA